MPRERGGRTLRQVWFETSRLCHPSCFELSLLPNLCHLAKHGESVALAPKTRPMDRQSAVSTRSRIILLGVKKCLTSWLKASWFRPSCRGKPACRFGRHGGHSASPSSQTVNSDLSL